jgi:hypothetical protein
MGVDLMRFVYTKTTAKNCYLSSTHKIWLSIYLPSMWKISKNLNSRTVEN